jgi:predicted phosphodiesterase
VSARIAVLSDVHGVSLALEAVRKAIRKEQPDVVMVAGDLAMNGPDPAGSIDRLREMEAEGAIVVQGNTDVAVADGDYAAAFSKPVSRTRCGSPPSGPTTRSTTSSSPGFAGCRPSAASESATR